MKHHISYFDLILTRFAVLANQRLLSD